MKKLTIILILLFVTLGSYGQAPSIAFQIDTLDQNNKDLIKSPSFDSDSTFHKFSQSILGIEIAKNPLEGLKSDINKDSILQTKRFMPGTSGQLSLGYEYGLLTGYIDPTVTDPLNVFNTRGDFSVEALNLPVNLSYNYSTFKNPLGVNNYFRASLDTEKLKQNVNEKKNKATGSLDKSIGDIESSKGLLQGKMGMGEVLLQKYKRQIETEKEKMNSLQSKIDNQVASSKESYNKDNLNIDSTAAADRINSKNYKNIDSLKRLHDDANNKYQKAMMYYDTINNLYQKAMNIYNTYSSWQDQLSTKKSSLDNFSKQNINDQVNSAGNDKKDGFISNIKTLDLGLSYPKTTGLSKNSIPIQGLNFEMQKEQWYLALSSGVTMNNLMVSTDAVQNKLNNSQNLFNQFDFQNIKERGWLTNIKSGYGTIDGTHFLIGFRYLTNSIPLAGSPNDSTNVPSLGNEIDVRWIPNFSQGTKIDIVYGKTSFRDAIIDSSRSNVLNSLYSNDRTNTGLVSISQQIKKLNTEIQTGIRWIDPHADVRSLGVLQPDNFRYDIRTTSTLIQGMRLGLNYRHDQNNVASQKDTTLNLNIIGGQLNGTVFKTITYFTSINYLSQTLKHFDLIERKNNYMLGFGISTNYKIGKVKNSVTASYNDYLITDSISTGLFRNISLQHMSKFEVGVNKFSIGYFQMRDDILQSNSSYIFGDEFSFQKDRLKLTLGIKVAQSEVYGSDLGGKLEANYRITKNLEWSLKGEKLVLGDFYNYYSRDRFDRFPYAITTRLNFIFN